MGEKGKKATWIPIEEPDERYENSASLANADADKDDVGSEEDIHYAHYYGDEEGDEELSEKDVYVLIAVCWAILIAAVLGAIALVYGGVKLIWKLRTKKRQEDQLV